MLVFGGGMGREGTRHMANCTALIGISITAWNFGKALIKKETAHSVLCHFGDAVLQVN